MTSRMDSIEPTVVLWYGQYHADAVERLAIVENYDRALFGLRNPRVVGTAGSWVLVAEASTAGFLGVAA